MLRWRRRREALRWEREAERLQEAGEALRGQVRRIWLEPGYPRAQPVRADVGESLDTWVWAPDTLPLSPATRLALERWAYDRFDELYRAWTERPEDNEAAERTFEADAITLVERMREELGPDWDVGLHSEKLERPVFDLSEMPADEWLYRFNHVSGRHLDE